MIFNSLTSVFLIGRNRTGSKAAVTLISPGELYNEEHYLLAATLQCRLEYRLTFCITIILLLVEINRVETHREKVATSRISANGVQAETSAGKG